MIQGKFVISFLEILDRKNTCDSVSLYNMDKHGLSQNKKLGGQNLKNKIFGHYIFQGKPQYTQITTRSMHFLIEIRHNILAQCCGSN